jgi:hypothetical protein
MKNFAKAAVRLATGYVTMLVAFILTAHGFNWAAIAGFVVAGYYFITGRLEMVKKDEK